MDRNLIIIQFGIAVFIFLCVITEVIAHIIMGTSAKGILVSAFFIALAWTLVRSLWKELRNS